MKFRRKAPVVEAFKWTGSRSEAEAVEWFKDALVKGYVEYQTSISGVPILLLYPHRVRWTVFPGDWVIRYMNGEIHSYDSLLFSNEYEQVEEKKV